MWLPPPLLLHVLLAILTVCFVNSLLKALINAVTSMKELIRSLPTHVFSAQPSPEAALTYWASIPFMWGLGHACLWTLSVKTAMGLLSV